MATIADKLTTIAGIKTDIRTAINGKGGSLTSGSPFSAYSTAISSLPSGGGYPPDWSQIGYTGTPQAVLDAFSYAKNIHDNWNPAVTSLQSKFKGDKGLVYMPMVNTSAVTRMNEMFSGCTSLSVVPLLDTSSCTNMDVMFDGCSSLTSVPLFDTSSVAIMRNMFRNCSALTSVPAFNTSACTNMDGMFDHCTGLTSVPAFDTSQVTRMQNTFRACSGLTSIPALDTSQVTSMAEMFSECSSLTSVPALNTSACTYISRMFNSCSNLTSIPALDTSQVTVMEYMFNGCSSLQKITSLDMSKCTSFGSMFGFSNLPNLRFMLLKGLGTPSGVTSYENSRMTNCTNWGVADSTYTDARQSLVDSLLTYSFDRATAGYATCTVKLSSNSYNQLTSQELADIQAKGYTITT